MHSTKMIKLVLHTENRKDFYSVVDEVTEKTKHLFTYINPRLTCKCIFLSCLESSLPFLIDILNCCCESDFEIKKIL